MTIPDRGTIKWASLMLPEHVTLLKEVFHEAEKKPILDAQKELEIDQKLKYSLRSHCDLQIKYFTDGDIQKIQSKLEKIDQHRGCLILASVTGTAIKLNDVLDVEIIEEA